MNRISFAFLASLSMLLATRTLATEHPPVDSFTSHTGELSPTHPRAAIARAIDAPPHVVPPAPQWQLSRPTPPLAYPPEAEPVSVKPAASAMGVLSPSDEIFAERAALNHYGDALLARLAAGKASRSATRTVARRIQHDEATAFTALRTLVEPRDVQLPTHVDSRYAAENDRLTHLSDEQFDHEYARLQLQNHRLTIDLFRRHLKQGSDPLLRSWAQTQLTVLQQHSQALRDLLSDRPPGV